MQGVRSTFLKSCCRTQEVAPRHGAAHGAHTQGNDWEGVTAPLGKQDVILMISMVILSGGFWHLFFWTCGFIFPKNRTPKSLWVCGHSPQQKILSAAFEMFGFVLLPSDWELFTFAHRVTTATKLPSTKN